MALAIVPSLLLAAACAPQSREDALANARVKGPTGKADSSDVATFVDFAFDGSLVADSRWSPKSKIEDQLLYTIGMLNGERSVGRLDKVVLTNVETKRQSDGKYLVTYSAKMLVAWGKKNSVPETYELVLPKRIGYQALRDFTAKYKDDCVDWSAHDVDSGSMWYYFRPDAWRCKLADDDIVRTTATVTPSTSETTGKFPEYDKVWKDGVLRVLAVFGKYEDNAKTASDAGISAYNRFLGSMSSLLRDYGLETTPADLPSNPGVDVPDVTFRANLADGRKVVVTVLLVDNVRTAGSTFNSRYASLSSDADLIVYSGHAGLGANVRALASKGRWVRGQYAIVFLNGCDTFAYIDDALAKAHARVNPDDPNGTKYLDIVTNAMPSYFSSMAAASTAFVRALMSYDDPQTYEQIFKKISSRQVVLVSGEEDNTYTPGGGGDPDDKWDGLSESGTVARNAEDHFATPTLPAGTYVFTLGGNNDADLYVRIGNKPTKSSYDCRPYRYGSSETCTVTIDKPTKIYVMVRGWDPSSDYTLDGARER